MGVPVGCSLPAKGPVKGPTKTWAPVVGLPCHDGLLSAQESAHGPAPWWSVAGGLYDRASGKRPGVVGWRPCLVGGSLPWWADASSVGKRRRNCRSMGVGEEALDGGAIAA